MDSPSNPSELGRKADAARPTDSDGQRVRVAMNWLVQGSPAEGVRLDEGPTGISIRKDNGTELFIPWTSVAYVVRNPEVDDALPF